MTPEREAELFAKFDLLLEFHRQTQGRLDRIEATQAEANARLREVEGAVRELTGRIQEQSSILQVALASRMGRKPAA